MGGQSTDDHRFSQGEPNIDQEVALPKAKRQRATGTYWEESQHNDAAEDRDVPFEERCKSITKASDWPKSLLAELVRAQLRARTDIKCNVPLKEDLVYDTKKAGDGAFVSTVSLPRLFPGQTFTGPSMAPQ